MFVTFNNMVINHTRLTKLIKIVELFHRFTY